MHFSLWETGPCRYHSAISYLIRYCIILIVTHKNAQIIHYWHFVTVFLTKLQHLKFDFKENYDSFLYRSVSRAQINALMRTLPNWWRRKKQKKKTVCQTQNAKKFVFFLSLHTSSSFYFFTIQFVLFGTLTMSYRRSVVRIYAKESENDVLNILLAVCYLCVVNKCTLSVCSWMRIQHMIYFSGRRWRHRLIIDPNVV